MNASNVATLHCLKIGRVPSRDPWAGGPEVPVRCRISSVGRWRIAPRLFVVLSLVSTIVLPVMAAPNADSATTPIEPPEAAAAYHAALLKRPDSEVLLSRFIDAWIENGGSHAEVERFLTQRSAASDSPDAGNSVDLRLLAAYLLGKGDTAAARSTTEAWTQRFPEEATAHFELAKLEARANEFSNALTSLNRAAAALGTKLEEESISVRRLSEAVQRLRGRLLIRTGNSGEGLATLNALLAAQPDDEMLHEDIVEMLAVEGLFDDAIASLRRLIENSDDAYAATVRRIRLGQLLHQARRGDDGLGEWRIAMQRTGHGSWLEKEIIARIETHFRRLDQLDGLHEYLDELIATDPGRMALRVARARLFTDQRDDDRAIAAWRELLALTPGDRDLRFEFLQALKRLGRHDEAVVQVESLIDLAPDDLSLLPMLADFQQSAGRAADAGATLLRYLDRSTANEGEQLRVARVLDGYGQAELCESVYQKLLEANPESADGRDGYAHFLFKGEEQQRLRAIELWTELAREGDPHRLLGTVQTLARRRQTRLAHDLLKERIGELGDHTACIDEFCQLAMSLGPEEIQAALPHSLRLVENARDSAALLNAIDRVTQLARRIDGRQALLDELLGKPDLSLPLRCLHATLAADLAEDSAEAVVLLSLADTPPEADQATDPMLAIDVLVAIHRRFDEWDAAAVLLRTRLAKGARPHPHTIEMLAYCLEKAGQIDDALVWTQEWRTLEPAKVAAWLNEARLQQQLGNTKAALGLLRQAVRKFDERHELKLRLASVCIDSGRHEEAEAIYWKLYDESESDGERRGRIGQLTRLAMAQKNSAPLIERLGERQRSNARSAAPWMALAEAHRILENFDDQRDALLAAARLEPENLGLLRDIAALEAREGHFEAALRTLQRAITLDRSDRSRDQLARLYFQLGRPSEALDALGETAFFGQSSQPADIVAVVQAVITLGEWDSATTLLESALKRYPDSPSLRWLEAVSLDEAGRKAESTDRFLGLLTEAMEKLEASPLGGAPGATTTIPSPGLSASGLASFSIRYLHLTSGEDLPAIAPDSVLAPSSLRLRSWIGKIPLTWSYRDFVDSDDPLYALPINDGSNRGAGGMQVTGLPIPSTAMEQVAATVAHLLRRLRYAEDDEAEALRQRIVGCGLSAQHLEAAELARTWQRNLLSDWSIANMARDRDDGILAGSWQEQVPVLLAQSADFATLWTTDWSLTDMGDPRWNLIACQTLTRELGDEAGVANALAILNRNSSPTRDLISGAAVETNHAETDRQLLELALAGLERLDPAPDHLIGSAAGFLLWQQQSGVVDESETEDLRQVVDQALVDRLAEQVARWKPVPDTDAGDTLQTVIAYAGVSADADRWFELLLDEQQRCRQEQVLAKEEGEDEATTTYYPLHSPARSRHHAWLHTIAPERDDGPVDPFAPQPKLKEPSPDRAPQLFPPPSVPGISPLVMDALFGVVPGNAGRDGEAIPSQQPSIPDSAQFPYDRCGDDRVLRTLMAAARHDEDEVSRSIAALEKDIIQGSTTNFPGASLLLGCWHGSLEKPPLELDAESSANASVVHLEAASAHADTDPFSAKAADMALMAMAWNSDSESRLRQIGVAAAERLLVSPVIDLDPEWQQLGIWLKQWNRQDIARMIKPRGGHWAATTGTPNPALSTSPALAPSAPPMVLPTIYSLRNRLLQLVEKEHLERAQRLAAAQLPQIACRLIQPPRFTDDHSANQRFAEQLQDLLDQHQLTKQVIATARPPQTARRIEKVRFAAMCQLLGHAGEALDELRDLAQPPTSTSPAAVDLQIIEWHLLALNDADPLGAVAEIERLMESPDIDPRVVAVAESTIEKLLITPRENSKEMLTIFASLEKRIAALSTEQQHGWPSVFLSTLFEFGYAKPSENDSNAIFSVPQQVERDQAAAIHRRVVDQLSQLPNYSFAVYLHLRHIDDQRNQEETSSNYPGDIEQLATVALRAAKHTNHENDTLWSSLEFEHTSFDAGEPVDPFATGMTVGPTTYFPHPARWLIRRAAETGDFGPVDVIIDDWSQPAASDGANTAIAAENARTLQAFAGLWRCDPGQFDAAVNQLLDLAGESVEHAGSAVSLIFDCASERSDLDTRRASTEALITAIRKRPLYRYLPFLNSCLNDVAKEAPAEASLVLQRFVDAAIGSGAEREQLLTEQRDIAVFSYDESWQLLDAEAENSNRDRLTWLLRCLNHEGFPHTLCFAAADLAREFKLSAQSIYSDTWRKFERRFSEPLDENDLATLLANSPLLATAADFDPVSRGRFSALPQGYLNTLAGVVLRELRFPPREKTLALLNEQPPSFGRDLLTAIASYDEATPHIDEGSKAASATTWSFPALAVYTEHLDALRQLPDDQQRLMALLANDLIDPETLSAPISRRQRLTLDWIRRYTKISCLVDLAATTEPDQLKNLRDPNDLTGLASRLGIASALTWDREAATAACLSVFSPDRETQNEALDATLMAQLLSSARPPEALALFSRLQRSAPPSLSFAMPLAELYPRFSWRHPYGSDEDAAGATVQLMTALAADFSEQFAGDDRDSILTLPVFATLLKEAPGFELLEVIHGAPASGSSDDSSPRMLREMKIAARLLAIKRPGNFEGDGIDEHRAKASAHLTAALSDDDSPLGVRLAISQFLCSKDWLPSLPESVALAIMDTVGDAWRANLQVPGLEQHLTYLEKLDPAKEDNRPTFEHFVSAFASRYLAASEAKESAATQAERFTPDILNRIAQLLIGLKRFDELARFVERYHDSLDAFQRYPLFLETVRAGAFEAATTLLRHQQIEYLQRGARDFRYGVELAGQEAALVATLTDDPALQWMAAMVIEKLDDPESLPAELPDRETRLKALARDYNAIDFSDPVSAEAALLWLAQRKVTEMEVSNALEAFVLKQTADDLRQSEGTRRDDLIELFRSALPSLIRQGKTESALQLLDTTAALGDEKLRDIFDATLFHSTDHCFDDTPSAPRPESATTAIEVWRYFARNHTVSADRSEVDSRAATILGGALGCHALAERTDSFPEWLQSTGKPSYFRFQLEHFAGSVLGNITWLENADRVAHFINICLGIPVIEAAGESKPRTLASLWIDEVLAAKNLSTLGMRATLTGAWLERLSAFAEGRETRKAVLLKVIDLIENRTGGGWIRLNYDGETSTTLLAKIHCRSGDWEDIGILLELLAGDETPSLIYSWSGYYGIARNFTATLTENEGEFGATLDSIGKQVNFLGPDALLLPIMIECASKVGRGSLPTTLDFTKGRDDAMARMYSLAGQIVVHGRGQAPADAERPTPWLPEVQAMLDDSTLSLSWRLSLARSLLQQMQGHAPQPLVLQSKRLLAEVLEANAPHIGAEAAIVVEAFNALDRSSEWDALADRLIAAWEKADAPRDDSAKGSGGGSSTNAPTFRMGPGTDACLGRLELFLKRGRGDLASALLEKQVKHLGGQPRTLGILVRQRDFRRARSFANALGAGFLAPSWSDKPWEYDPRFDAKLAEATQAFLDTFDEDAENQDDQFLARVMLECAPDPLELNRRLEDDAVPKRDSRVQALRASMKTLDLSPETRRQAELWLSAP